MTSFTAFGRRLMLSTLIAFWIVSLVYVIWIFIRDEATNSAVGFADLYAPSLANRWSPAIFIAIQTVLLVGTVLLAVWEIRSSRYHPHADEIPHQN